MDISNATILVIDDIEQNINVVSQMLKSKGLRVAAALSGQTALRMVERRKPDLILLDVMMPEMDGFETCSRLKAKPGLENVPVIFLSALNDVETKVKGLEVGGVDYITKPFQELEVLARVKLHLNNAFLERERTEHIDKLKELNEEKDKMMQIVSHDLRSPLGSIKNLADILTEGEEAYNPKTVIEYAGLIATSSESLIGLVNDLLDLAKIESGSMALNLSEFDIREHALASIESLQALAYKKGILMSLECGDDELIVLADRPKLMQIFNNLLSNAVKFTPNKGKITFEVRENGEELQLIISDSGIGIPPESIPHLFEKFGKHQRPGTSGEKGTGLGMPIVKRFIGLHGGTVQVESREGQGTTFVLTMPKRQNENKGASPSSSRS